MRLHMQTVATCVLALLSTTITFAQSASETAAPLYRDASQPVDTRVDDLIERL